MAQFPLGHHLTSIMSLEENKRLQNAALHPALKMWCQRVKVDKCGGFVLFTKEKKKSNGCMAGAGVVFGIVLNCFVVEP